MMILRGRQKKLKILHPLPWFKRLEGLRLSGPNQPMNRDTQNPADSTNLIYQTSSIW
jgi:hypothetical protein